MTEPDAATPKPAPADPASALFQLRRDARMTQKELASALKLDQATICRFERGKTPGFPALLAKPEAALIEALSDAARKVDGSSVPDLENRVHLLFTALRDLRTRPPALGTGEKGYFAAEGRYLRSNRADLWIVAPPRLAIADRSAEVRDVWLNYLEADIDIHVILAIDLLAPGVLEGLEDPLARIARRAQRLRHPPGRITFHRAAIVESGSGRDSFLDHQNQAYDHLARSLAGHRVVRFRQLMQTDADCRRRLAGWACRLATLAASVPRVTWQDPATKRSTPPFVGFIVRNAHPAAVPAREGERYWMYVDPDEARSVVEAIRPFATASRARGVLDD